MLNSQKMELIGVTGEHVLFRAATSYLYEAAMPFTNHHLHPPRLDLI